MMTIWQYNIWSTSWSTDFPQPLATLCFYFLQEIVLSDLVPIDRMGNQVALAQARGSIWTISASILSCSPIPLGYGQQLGVFCWPYDDGFPTKNKGGFSCGWRDFPLDFPMIKPLHPIVWKIPSINLVWFGRLERPSLVKEPLDKSFVQSTAGKTRCR